MSNKISILDQTLNIHFDDQKSDEAMLLLIEQRVTQMLSENPDLLFSYLYRLDIEEVKIKEALNNSQGVSPNLAVAELILNRQKERIASKKKYKQDPPIEGWEF